MNYIVFDLEWNQSPSGKKYADSHLPFEIIEIGAVKLNEKKEIVDSFQRLIKPKVYKWIHNSIHEVIHVNYRELTKGIPFTEAVEEFLKWCGKDRYFFTWGNQDVMELQRNMKYYGMLELLPGPVTYYDVQKLFSIRYEDSKKRRSLEYAIDELGIDKNREFHRALADAHYTARVLQTIETENILPNSSIDVYQNPKTKKEEIYISYPTYDKYVSREFSTRDKMIKDKEAASTRCPVCHCAARRKIRWFAGGAKAYYSVSVCSEHGLIKGKLRVRKTEEGAYYGVKTLKCIDTEEAEKICLKRESLRHKRQVKRNSSKEI